MSVLAILAFAAGLTLGFLFRPLAVVAVATAFVLVIVVFGSDLGFGPLTGVLLAVVLINVGYLAGTVISRRWFRSDDSEPRS